MRTELAPLLGKRATYFAVVKRFGWRKFMGQFVGKTVLLVSIKDSQGNPLIDGKGEPEHLWFKCGKGFDKLKLKPRDMVAFDATVGTYTRGRRDSDDYDYHLEYPKKLRKVEASTLRETGQTELFAAVV